MRNLPLLIMLSFLAFACSRSPRFQRLSSEKTGISFINEITETDSFHVLSYEYIYNGAGVGIGDLNNDGLQDIIFAGNMVSPRIYLNMGNFKFRDITSGFKGLSNDQWHSSVTLVDINNDRWLDVYFTCTGDSTAGKSRNRLWINNGSGGGNDPTFTEMAEKYGIADDRQSVHASFFDYDLDGDLDLYVLNNTVTQRESTRWRTKIKDGSATNNDQLYRNNGDGTFTNVSLEAGIVIEGFGLGLAIGDFNKDGYPDIYVSNDYMSNDLLYINQGNGTFINEISKFLSYQTKSSMGDDVADINNDGNLDIFTLDMLPASYHRKKQTINGFSYVFYINDAKFDYEHQFLRNMMHLHNGWINGEMVPFSEVGQQLGIFDTEWSWSPLFADYDNDGDKDLIVANGYPVDMTDKDWTKYKAEVYGSLGDDQHVIDMAPSAKVPNIAFENTGSMKFIRRTSEWLGSTPSYSYGAAFADLDNDGDLDYVTNNIDDEAFIFKNKSIERSRKNANFIKVKLIGIKGNTMALGAKIELWTNGGIQYAENFLTRGYASSVDPIQHFGLGSITSVDSVRVTWPATGNITVMSKPEINRIIIFDENTMPGVQRKPINQINKYLFEKSVPLFDYEHQQNDFADFFLSQKIMPHKFSQIGPCMAKGDINNDGIEDIIIGSTNTLPTVVYIRKGNGFEKTDFKGLTGLKNFTESDLIVLDIDNDGDNDVISVAGAYENKNEEEYRHYVYLNHNNTFENSLLPIPQFPASVIRPIDFDNDGDLDFFIGSRVKKGMFPYANNSWLVLNDNGRLYVEPWSKVDLGMVTDAVWTDYDNDGWKDLLVAREWNTLVFLKNINGKNVEAQTIKGMESNPGFWYSLTAADFDQDGDEDYIAGNLGENHRFTISEQYPLNLYAIDIDMDGVIDPLTTGFWPNTKGEMTEFPVNYLDELWSQSAYFQSRFVDYASFSYASFADMIQPSLLNRAEFKLQAKTTSSYILWNDGDGFRWEKLPADLQVAPIKKTIVDDFNGDGLPDVLITGNDHTFDIATGYYDASKGFVLLNNGKAGFKVLKPSESGFAVKGMVESLLYFKGDTSLVVVGVNRDKPVVFKVKKR
jgi:hypothetical protein